MTRLPDANRHPSSLEIGKFTRFLLAPCQNQPSELKCYRTYFSNWPAIMMPRLALVNKSAVLISADGLFLLLRNYTGCALSEPSQSCFVLAVSFRRGSTTWDSGAGCVFPSSNEP